MLAAQVLNNISWLRPFVGVMIGLSVLLIPLTIQLTKDKR